MTEYKNLPENYPLFNNTFKKTLPFVLILGAVVAYACYNTTFNGNYNYKGSLALFAIFIVILALSYMSGQKRRKQIYNSYRLIVDNEMLTRKQSNLIDITIPLNEIIRIDEMNKGALAVRSQQKDDSIVIWPYIENYNELRTFLETYCRATPIVYKNIFQRYPLLFGLLIVVSMTMVYVSSNKIIVAISAVVVLCCVVWTFYKTKTTKQVDAGMKRWAWVMLIFLLFIALAAYKKLIS